MIHPLIPDGRQLKVFADITKDELVEGKYRCPSCYSVQRVNPSRLTDSTVFWAQKALDWCYANKSLWQFDVQQVFTADDMHGRARRGTPSDAQYLRLVKKVAGKPNWWEFTMIGRQFLAGRIQISNAAWVKDGVVLWYDEEMRHIGNVDPEWRSHLDHLLDYILLNKDAALEKMHKLGNQQALTFNAR